ncbi:CrcB family protein [Actinokineospora sp. G85]|uniref:CrcB family protein n=1 Tax=Actinokineospora sp. G85 TaxID=3406626 RepID=UPI003C75EBD0
MGVLGGFTTFSTYAVETVQRPPVLAVLYAAATLAAALAAVFVGAWATRAVAR